MIHVPISLQTWSTDNRIEDNDIVTDAKNTIDIDETSGYNTIKNNRLSSAGGGGSETINDRSGKNFISGNSGSRYDSGSDSGMAILEVQFIQMELQANPVIQVIQAMQIQMVQVHSVM